MREPACPPPPVADAPGSPDTLVVSIRPWADPIVERFGHDPRSAYVERFWLPIVGPSGVLLLRRLAGGFDVEPEGFDLDLTATAQALGMARRDGPSASFRRTLDRIIGFGFAHVGPGPAVPGGPAELTLVVRRRLPGLTRRQIQRLPRYLRHDHERWLAGQPSDEVIGARVQHLALSLLELGEDPGTVGEHLLRLDFHPTVVGDALVWAGQRVGERRAERPTGTSGPGGPSGTTRSTEPAVAGAGGVPAERDDDAA